MANEFNDMLQNLFGAIEEISSAQMNSLNFDKTVTAQIKDATNAEKGEYIVSDGSTTFKAYSDNPNYGEEAWVYVQIPNGDYNNQKIITGRYLKDNIEYYTYLAALDRHIDATSNLIDTLQEPLGLVANGDKKQITVWERTNFPDGCGYDRIGIRGEFSTWLSALKATGGSYGLRVDIIGEETKTTQTDPENKYYSFKLDCKDFYGDPYNFETFYSQEIAFDISHIDKIIAIKVVFYQEGNFTNEKGVLIPSSMADGTKLTENIFIQNPYVSLGYDFDSLEQDEVRLYTLNSKTYAKELTNDVKKRIFSESGIATSEQAALMNEYYSKVEKIKEYEQKLDEFNTSYAKQIKELGEELGVGSQEYQDELLAIQAEREEQINNLSNRYTQYLVEEKDFEQSKIYYNEKINHLYSLVNFHDEDIINQYLDERNLKTIQMRWIHKKEDGSVVSIDSVDKMPEGAKIHWYKYNLSDNGVADKLAGPFWEEIYPNGNVNSFAYINFLPNKNSAEEIFKVIIEYYSEDFVESEIYEDSDIYRIKQELAADDAETDAEDKMSEEVRVEKEDELANLIAAHREKIKYFESEQLTFTNEHEVPNTTTIQLIDALEILCDEENHKGIYNLYTQDGTIISQAEATKKRILTANYNTLITGQDTLDTAEEIIWKIPIVNTMIQEPTEGIEYETYSKKAVLSADELKAGGYYIYENNQYTLVTPDHQWNSQNVYYVKNQITVNRNEAEGYVEIIRQGVVSSRIPGSEEADTSEQYFRIKPFYSQGMVNNTVECIIKKNNQNYSASYTLSFGAVGTNGTDYTLILEIDGNDPAVTWSADKEKRKPLILKPRVFDYEHNEITEDFMSSAFTYTFESFGGGGITYSGKDGNSAIISISDSVAIGDGKTRDTVMSDCYHYLLKCSVKALIKLKETEVETKTVEDEAAQDSAKEEQSGETKTVEDANEPKEREVDLTVIMGIPVRNGDKWTEFSGTDRIVYDSTGVNASYYQGKQHISYYDAAQQKTLQDSSIKWRTEFGSLTGYKIIYDTDIDESVESKNLNNAKVEKCYPTITEDGKVTPVSLFLQDNAPNFSFVGYTTDENNENEVIQWIQPVHIYQNSYSSTMLNAWDGSLTIDRNNGKILTTMIGAGKKDDENRFNGVLMGDVSLAGENEGKVPDNAPADVKKAADDLAKYYSGTGLYGYHEGIKSFGLNINGRAFFGKPGNGQILIDGNSGSIQSRRYIQTKSNVGKEFSTVDGETYYDIDKDVAGMCIDLNKGTLATYGDGTAASVVIDPTPASDLKPLFGVKSSAGNDLIFIGDKNYYLQSDNYSYTGKTGTKIDIAKGNIDSYNFNLNAEGPNGAYLKLKNVSPYLQIYSGSKMLVDVGDNKLIFTSNNYTAGDFASTAANAAPTAVGSGMQIDLYEGTIKGHGLDLIAYNPKNSNQYVRLNSGASLYPLKVENTTDNTHVRLGWDGGIHCNYGDIGGWSITGDRLKDKDGKIFLCPDGASNKIDIAGHDDVQGLMIKAGTGFGVTTAGDLYSNAGYIGGWTINSEYLRSESASGRITLRSSYSTSPNDFNVIRVDKKIDGKWSEQFTVSNTGKMSAKGADIEGTITANYGFIGNWQISSGSLKAGNTTLSSNGSITCQNLTTSGTVKIGGDTITIGDTTVSISNLSRVMTKINSISIWREGVPPKLHISINYSYAENVKVLNAGNLDKSDSTSASGSID